MTKRTAIIAFAVAALLPRIAAAQSIGWNEVGAALGKTATVGGEVHR